MHKKKEYAAGKKAGALILICVLLAALLTACGNLSDRGSSSLASDQKSEEQNSQKDNRNTWETQDLSQRDTDISPQLTWERSMELQYAQCFAVDYYEGGYILATVLDGSRFLIVPEHQEVPEGLDEDITMLQQPLNGIYLVASAAMDMFRALDAVDTVRFSGQKEEGWYIEEAKEAMDRGDMLYAGKYSAPDYELLVSEGCSLAVENTMISHSPEVTEKLADFYIPVLIDYSSYEDHPLGRVEWVRFYGALLGREEQAREAFQQQAEALERVSEETDTGKTVAFFYITTNGAVNVRQSSDYVPKMIELAGGAYIFENLGDPDSRKSSMNMQMEEFYAGAKDADYLIYNSTIDGGIESMEELLAKSELLADFKAVKEGNVWCTTRELYQESMSIGAMIEDIHKMVAGKDESGESMTYLYPLKQ